MINYAEVVVLVEGPTEQRFVKQLLAPYMAERGVYLTPIISETVPPSAMPILKPIFQGRYPYGKGGREPLAVVRVKVSRFRFPKIV
jgi:hypothetical protein